jgi:two-component system response regulator FlrC
MMSLQDGSDQQAKWEKIAGLAKLRLLKNDSYVFVDETSQHLLALVERVGAAEVTALMYGPTGSGKEVLARLTHDFSPRRDGPFVPVNCAALPEALAESLLFGHAKGAFTGATRSTEGFFTQAQGGTLFLDEIGELTLPLQAKLLRAIQEKEVLPVGSSETQRVDVRIVAGNKSRFARRHSCRLFPRGSLLQGKHLSYQCTGVICPAGRYPAPGKLFLGQAQVAKTECSSCRLKQRRSFWLTPWPGNVRELENVVQRAIVLSNDGVIAGNHLVFDEPADHELYAREPVPMDNVHAF